MRCNLFLLVLVLLVCSCEVPVAERKEVSIKTTEEYSVYPRPRMPVVTKSGNVGFYNRAFDNFLFFSADDGIPAKKSELSDFPLNEMYDQIAVLVSDTVNLISFNDLYENPEEYLRMLSAEGVFVAENGVIYTIVRMPYVYVDDSFVHEGRVVTANIRRSMYFLVRFDDNLSVDDYYIIDDSGLPEEVGLIFYSPQLIFKGSDLIVPLTMDPNDFIDREGEIPAYTRLTLMDGKFVVQDIFYTPHKDWFRFLGNVAVMMHPFFAPASDGNYYMAAGNQIWLMDRNSWEVSDEPVFQDCECERISFFREKGEQFFYLCSDFIFEMDIELDFLIQVKSSEGKVLADINPLHTVNPFFDDNYLYYFVTGDDFAETILVAHRLK